MDLALYGYDALVPMPVVTVSVPVVVPLAELKRFPARSQITHQACEEGWSFIAEWTGVPLSSVLNVVGVSTRVTVGTPESVERTLVGKARRVVDKRPR